MASSDPQLPAGSRRAFLRGAGGVLGAATATSAAAQAAGGTDGAVLLPRDFGAIGDGAADDGPALQRLLNAAHSQRRPAYIPAGVYRIGATLRVPVDEVLGYAHSFSAGAQIVGAGPGLTVFETMIADGPVFDLDASGAGSGFRAALGPVFEGFTIRGAERGLSSGIRLRSAFNATLRGLHIIGLGGTGIEVVCREGDQDGSNMVTLEQVRIENCLGWGVDAAAEPGLNEISFLKLEHVFIQRCGRPGTGGGAPTSGGMRWKGQVCTLEQCGFAINENVGIYIPGQAGLAQTIDVRSTGFENNVGRHLLVTGISGFRARNIQFYSNDTFRVAVACEFDASSNTVRNVDVDGVTVRATAANRQLAFRLGGPHAELDSCRVRGVVWENFDHPGQRRFDGWLFDHVEQCCSLRVTSAGVAEFGPDPARPGGNRTPLRLRGGAGGAPADDGEWVAAAILSPLVLRAGSLAPGRTWFVYLVEHLGSKRLVAADRAPVLDPASGYAVDPDDRVGLYVGTVRTDNAGGFIAAEA